YMLNKNFGIEAGISSLGEPNDSSIPANMHVETEVYDVYAVGKYYASENLSFFGKAGFATSRTESEIGDDDETETNHSSTNLALGLGGQYDISERFGIRTEMEWLDGKAAGLERVLSLSGVMRFGK
ncbi:MAG: porin family protein, partial [Gammaproteobacteria bacterium]|nr:porin family protein [Gammaproteobacteria bacterium]